jgi:hypothetical protein
MTSDETCKSHEMGRRNRALLKRLLQPRYYIVLLFMIIFIIYYTGWSEHPRTISYHTNFSWPLDRPDFRIFTEDIINKRPLYQDIEVVNPFAHKFIISEKCIESNIDLVILIKTRLENSQYRHVIRETWGNEALVKKELNMTIKKIFLVGSCDSFDDGGYDWTRTSCIDRLNQESMFNRDIVQVDFIDNYFNSTLKTISMYKWLVNNCSQAKYAFFADDDFYISVKNIFNFIKDPLNDKFNKMPDGYLPFDGRLYAGWVARGRQPNRIHSSKWYSSLSSYPFDYFPDFIAGGAYVVSNHAFKQIQASMQYVKPFFLEDTYLGIIARKLGLELLHNKRFINDDREYEPDNFQNIIAFHCKGDHDLSLKIWKEQNKSGHA